MFFRDTEKEVFFSLPFVFHKELFLLFLLVFPVFSCSISVNT